MRGILIALLVAGSWSPAVADDWWCYSTKYISECLASEGACGMRRDQAIARTDDSDDEVTLCVSQKKAAAVSWFDVMDDQTATMYMRTLASCNDYRRFLMKKKASGDVRAVSKCTPRPLPKSPAFDPKLVPSGEGWWCHGAASGESNGACWREEEPCSAKYGADECQQFSTAYVFAMPRGNAATLPTMRECNDVRDYALAGHIAASACQEAR